VAKRDTAETVELEEDTEFKEPVEAAV